MGVTAASLTGLLALSSCSVLDAQATVPEDWTPRGAVKITVAFAPGGGSDRSARALAQALNEEDLGFNANVENKDGGSGAVGWSSFLGEEGNGNSLLVAEGAINILPILYDVEFEYTDFTPIALFAEDSRVVVAPADSPFEDCNDLIDAARTDRVLAGVSGLTGADAIVRTALEQAGGVEFDAVPFSSSGEVVTALLSGNVDYAPVAASVAAPQIEAGEFTALCSMTAERYDDPVLADVETAREQGIDATVSLWRGFFAAGGIDEVQRQYWIDAAKRAIDSGSFDQYIEQDMLVPTELYGDDFADYLAEYQKEMEAIFS
ncbi:tripartite tricarboxylate transporter substrate binding protein [Mycetocola reblochoni]|nr:tripartite tricarboxylate transporter substrate binding protein [Mycetocola reblochoni]